MYATVIILWVTLAHLCCGLSYDDLVAHKMNCTPWDSCEHDAQSPTLPEWQVRNCYCDELCHQYGDCCLDSKFYSDESMRGSQGQFTCVEQQEPKGVYMRGTCMMGWKDRGVSELCLAGSVGGSSEGGRPDPFSSLPATSLHTSITYTNYYCAICNNDSLSLRLWTVRYSCDSLKNSTLDKDVALDNLVYQNNSWGILVPNNNTTIIPLPDNDTTSLYPPDNDTTTVYPPYYDTTTVYPPYYDTTTFHKCSLNPEIPNNVSKLTRTCVRAVRTCADDWSDEDVAAQCRAYTVLVYNATEPFRNPHCALCNHVDPKQISCNVLHINFRINEPSRFSFALLLDFHDVSGGNIVGSTSACTDTEIWDPFFRKCRNIICGRENEVYRYGRCVDGGDLDTTPSSDPTTQDTLDLITTTILPVTDPPTTSGTNRPIIFPGDITPAPESTPSAATTPSFSSTAISANASADFLECRKVLLAEEEIETFENGTVYVEAYRRTYEPYEYESVERGVLVCWPEVPVPTAKFSPIMGWVSLAGLGLSCLCLLLHLSAFILTPGLRNLSGRNLSSLSVSLLAAYMIFLASVVTQPGQMACFVLAAAMYYFFLASFAWMSAIAFDIWYTFRLTHRELRVSSGDQWHRFLGYCLYAWLTPAAFLALVVVIDLTEPQGIPEEMLPRLGQTWCWFGHRKALLVFFALPMVVILVANCAFFIITAAIITETTLPSPSTPGGSHQKGQYKMYLRLAVLMGFTWISGIVAGYLQAEAAWYVFVILNTLQGLFIFLAFTCRTRVWRALGDTCRGLGHRGVTWVAHRSPSDNQILELSQTPDHTYSASHSIT